MSRTLLVTITSGWLIFKAWFPWRLQNSTANYRRTKLYALGSSEDDSSFSSIDIRTILMVNKLPNPPIPKHLSSSRILKSWIITNMIMGLVGFIWICYQCVWLRFRKLWCMWNDDSIVGFYNGSRATGILLCKPNQEARYNLNQPLKERNQGYLSKRRCFCLYFLSFVRIHNSNDLAKSKMW